MPLCVACEGCSDAPLPVLNDPDPAAAVQALPESTQPQLRSMSLLEKLEHCDVSHRGILIDLGTVAADVRRSFSVGPFSDVVNVKRGGKTYAQTLTRELSYGFWLQRESPGLSVALRARAGLAQRVSVYIDDERLGQLRLPSEDADVVSAPEGRRNLEPGRHTVTLRFNARRRAEGDDPYAELDWVWVGDREQMTDRYAPPTFDDIVTDVALEGQPRRSIVLGAPATVRCALQAAKGEQLQLALGYWGNGQGTAQVRALVEGEPPVVLAEHQLSGGEEAHWKDVSVDLTRFEGKLIALELIALQASGSGRVAFGEPRVEITEPVDELLASAQNVVLVLMSGLSREALPPWGSAQGFRGITELVRQGVTFNGYRTRTTSSSAAVVSILTGLPPRLHSVEDQTSRLPQAVFTVSEMLKQAGGMSAMFTGVPTSFADFGLDRGWDRFVAISPVEDLPASQPLSEALGWLDDSLAAAPQQKKLMVVHLRGGHPPWDLSREDAANLPPEEYTGVLEARRGGIILSRLRASGASGRRRMRSEDWTRLSAMQAATLRRQDQALARLIDRLHEKQQWDNTLFVVAGDVAMGDPPNVPFGIAPLSEDRLLVPLLVKFPAGRHAGEQVGTACTSEDITRTLVEALGLPQGEQLRGESLNDIVSGRAPPGGRPLVAMMGNEFSTRWGPWLLLGELGDLPRLCQLEVDPSCASDLFADHPIAVSALWRNTFLWASTESRVEREPVKLERDTRNALVVWGD